MQTGYSNNSFECCHFGNRILSNGSKYVINLCQIYIILIELKIKVLKNKTSLFFLNALDMLTITQKIS
jgi:hypothetical protein